MKLLEKLANIWHGIDYPFLIHQNSQLWFSDIASQHPVDLSSIRPGDVVWIPPDEKHWHGATPTTAMRDRKSVV